MTCVRLEKFLRGNKQLFTLKMGSMSYEKKSGSFEIGIVLQQENIRRKVIPARAHTSPRETEGKYLKALNRT